MNILIATGIYPPEIGGPAQYAYNLENQFRAKGHNVDVRYFTKIERKLPTGLRHLYYLLKTLPAFVRADYILVLDTFSVAMPIYILSKIFRKSYTIRTGGDFLWESYVERTKKPILFKEFYKTEIPYFTKKEKLIFDVTKIILSSCRTIVFSTSWQQNIFIEAYGIDRNKTTIIENYYNISKTSTIQTETTPSTKNFLISTRNLFWKNKDRLIAHLQRLQKEFPEAGIEIDDNTYSHMQFQEKIRTSYAVVLMSLGDISPNMILDAIGQGTPFLLTTENGIGDRIRDIGLFANPLDDEDIYNKLTMLLDPNIYTELKQKLSKYSQTHSWEEMAGEYLALI